MESVQEKNEVAIKRFNILNEKFKKIIVEYQKTHSFYAKDYKSLEALVMEIDSILTNFEWYTSYRSNIYIALNELKNGNVNYLTSVKEFGLSSLLWELHEILIKNWHDIVIPGTAKLFWRKWWENKKSCYIIKAKDIKGYEYTIFVKPAGIDTHWVKIDVYNNRIKLHYNDGSLIRMWLILRLLGKDNFKEFGNRTKTIIGKYFSFSCQLEKEVPLILTPDELMKIYYLLRDTRDVNFFNSLNNMHKVYELNHDHGFIGRPLVILRKWFAFLTGKIDDLVSLNDPKYVKMYELDLYSDIT